MIKDSLGVPLEPLDKSVAEDWQGEDLFPEDEVFVTEYGMVKNEIADIREFLEATTARTTVKDYLYDGELEIWDL